MVGQTLGHYRVLEQIGAGGMGVVYRARDERLERDVALKVLPPGTLANETARKRFRKEALTLSQLNHPNIATVYDFDTQEGVDFLVMELIPGVTLTEKLEAGALPEKEISRLGAQLAQGLAAAHEQGVVHRDLKPGNVRVTPDGWLKILDFGLATLLRPEGPGETTLSATETAAVAGTLPYMSPEQLRGEKADARSDIYAAGVVLYEMATGRRPFAETSGAQLVAAILQQPPPAPSAVNKKVSPALEMIILKALDKEPDRRYQSAKELAVDLERLTSVAVAAVAPRRRHRWWLGVATAVVVLVAAAVLYLLGSRGKPLESIAVLPFVNASGAADTEYLSDGITETLIDSLARLPRLTVISRGSVFRYKGKEADPQAVGRELKVEAVVLGRMVQRGDSLSIRAELVDARDGRRLWGEQYSRKLADLMAIQEEIGREISEQLRLRLSGEQKKALVKRHTQNPEAWQEYLKGLYLWNTRTAASLQTAMEHFNRAIVSDRNFALAYVGLSECYRLLPYVGAVPPREFLPERRAAVNKALQLDDTLGEAHVALASCKMAAEWDWAGMFQEFQKGLQLNPAYATGHQLYGVWLMCVGRFDEAIAEVKRAQELDPVSLPISANVAMVYHYARRYDEALEHYRKMVALDPNYGLGRVYLGELYIAKSMYAEAVAELKAAVQIMQGAPLAIAPLALTYARSGDRAAAQAVLDKMLAQRSRGYYPASRIALVYVGMGDKDSAFEWLQRAVEEGDRGVYFFKTNPLFDPLRSDPRATEILRRMNLAP
ncbi:MAG: protein kinase [Acidobacteria bacterium]|nr:protein kinase [Acidobacteriota bacterium]